MRFRAVPTTVAVLLVSLMALGAPGLQAQQAAQPAPAPPDTEELVNFTEAYVKIDEVRQDIAPQVAAAQDAEAANRLQQQANERMMDILEDHEIEVERYRDITLVLNSDEELRAEFEALYVELAEGGGAGLH